MDQWGFLHGPTSARSCSRVPCFFRLFFVIAFATSTITNHIVNFHKPYCPYCKLWVTYGFDIFRLFPWKIYTPRFLNVTTIPFCLYYIIATFCDHSSRIFPINSSLSGLATWPFTWWYSFEDRFRWIVFSFLTVRFWPLTKPITDPVTYSLL